MAAVWFAILVLFSAVGVRDATAQAVLEQPVIAPSAGKGALQRLDPLKLPTFVSNNPFAHIVPPDQTPAVRINPEAPGPFVAMAAAYQAGDMDLAERYANQWVRYQMDFFFEVRELTNLIGRALIEQQVIDEDEWPGVTQLINYEFAESRKALGSRIKPVNSRAFERIVGDPKNEVEVYFFMTMNCSWCRKMAPDLERLWRIVQQDKKVKMVGLTLGKVPSRWLEEYRQYTGLTLPVYEGARYAKSFGIRFVPALVVVTPNKKRAYLKTGQQSFATMYEFLRRAQGLPVAITSEVERVMATPIGELEQKLGVPETPPARAVTGPLPVVMRAKSNQLIERF